MSAIKFLKKNKLFAVTLGALLWLEQLSFGSLALKISSCLLSESSIELGTDYISVNYYTTFIIYLIWVLTLFVFTCLLRKREFGTEKSVIKPKYVVFTVFGLDIIVFGVFVFPIGYVYFQHAAAWLGYALLYFTLRWRINHISGESSRSSQR